ncbi:MAG: low molecular weight protein-tyrosine-phosphatase [Kofleriaceae bacterium]
MRIVFVCLGNICRSPTAEGVMRHAIEAAGLGAHTVLDSAGTGAWHVGEPPDPRSRRAAGKRGYDLELLRARQFVVQDFAAFDLVVAMDRQNLADLERLAATCSGPLPPIRLLRSFDPSAPPGAEVPDPYSGGATGFEEVLDICERACAGLVEHVQASRASR